MSPQSATLIVACLGICGTLGGIAGGHLLTRSWQREQWIRDQRNNEFRELLVALSEAYRVELKVYAGAILGPEDSRGLVEAQSNAMAVMGSRIFTADVVQRYDLEVRWVEAIRNHHNTLEIVPLAEAFTGIRADILKEAIKSRQKVGSFRRT